MQVNERKAGTQAPSSWRTRGRAAGTLVAAALVMAMPAVMFTVLMFGASGLGLAMLWIVIAIFAGLGAVLCKAGWGRGDPGAFEAHCLRWAGNAPRAPASAPPHQGRPVVRHRGTRVGRRGGSTPATPESCRRERLRAA